MKMQLAVLLFLILVSFARAADQPPSTLTVAVYDFKGEADAASFGSKVTTLVTADLAAETNLVMLERADLDKDLNELAFGLSGMVSSGAAAKIGQLTGAKVLVAGQVIRSGESHLVIVADVIGTETGRLFADQVEGPPDQLMNLTAELSRKIARTIVAQSTNLVQPAGESREDHLSRIINHLQGTNRPAISLRIIRYGHDWTDATAESELSVVLSRAGFTVVDANSDRKPDLEITGGGEVSVQSQLGGLYSSTYILDVKIQVRLSGKIIGFDRQESKATAAGDIPAQAEAMVKAVDDLAERILPLLAK
jgi:TolB-like protein